MVPTLEDDVRKLKEKDDALYDFIMETHRGVRSLGQKLGDFQRTTDMHFGEVRTDIRGLHTEMHDFKREAAENFAAVDGKIADLRQQALDEFAVLRTSAIEVKASVKELDREAWRQGIRMTKFNERIDRLEGKMDRLEGKSDKQSKQLALIVRHLGITEE